MEMQIGWNLIDENFIKNYFVKCKEDGVIYAKSGSELIPIKSSAQGFKAIDIIEAMGPTIIKKFKNEFNEVLSSCQKKLDEDLLPALQDTCTDTRFIASNLLDQIYSNYIPRLIAGEINIISCAYKIEDQLNIKKLMLKARDVKVREIKCEIYLEALVTACFTYDISYIDDVPVSFSNDPTIQALHFFDTSELYKQGDTSMWKTFFHGKCSSEDLRRYMWWWGSLLDPTSYSRQALFIYDPQGNAGKGCLSDVLQELLGRCLCTVINGTNTFSNQFWGSKIFGKRLLVVDDNKNSHIMDQQWFYQLVSGDSVDVEFKGKDSFTYKPNLKMCIATNCLTIVKDEINSYSRILPITFKANYSDKTKLTRTEMKDQLFSQVAAWNYECKKVYESVKTIGGSYPISRDEVIKSPATSIDVETSDIYYNFLSTLQDIRITKDTMNSFFSGISSLTGNSGKLPENFKRNLCSYMNGKQIPFEEKRFKISNERYYGIKLNCTLSELKNILEKGDIESEELNFDSVTGALTEINLNKNVDSWK